MARYASNTDVTVDKSRAEIERILDRYGANGYSYKRAEIDGQRIEQIDFTTESRHVRFLLKMPSRSEFSRTPSRGQKRSEKATEKAWEQACRQRWRALALVVKAKLEAVECGISEFDREFFAQIVNPSTNRTVYEEVLPSLNERYAGIGGPVRVLGLPAPEDVESYS